MEALGLHGPRKSKPRVKSELCKQQFLTTIMHMAQVRVLRQMQTFICYCTVIALFYFEFEGNFQVQAPGGLYSESRFNGGIFALRV